MSISKSETSFLAIREYIQRIRNQSPLHTVYQADQDCLAAMELHHNLIDRWKKLVEPLLVKPPLWLSRKLTKQIKVASGKALKSHQVIKKYYSAARESRYVKDEKSLAHAEAQANSAIGEELTAFIRVIWTCEKELEDLKQSFLRNFRVLKGGQNTS